MASQPIPVPMVVPIDEKQSYDSVGNGSSGSIMTTIRDTFAAFQSQRESLGLTNPGTVDNVAKEVQRDVFLNNLTFSGLRAELTKAFSVSPMFQVCHSFAQGNQQMPPYVLMALYGTNRVFCQANLENDLSLTARFNYRWTSRWVTKASTQIAPASAAGPGGAQLSIENDYTGNDFTAQLKAMNPSALDGALTGIYIGSYLQSITPRLALGLEAVYQRPAATLGPESVMSYAARYKGDDWIASAQLLTQGGLQTSYWRRLSERVEAGVDLSMQLSGLGAGGGAMMGGSKNEGTATLGAKYDFRASNFRAQVDSTGKVSCLLEKRVVPLVGITFAGELDHAKNAAKLGLAVSIEAAEEEVMIQQERGTAEPVVPPF